MDLLNRTELELLAKPGPDGPHVSLFMPTHRFGGGIEECDLGGGVEGGGEESGEGELHGGSGCHSARGLQW